MKVRFFAFLRGPEYASCREADISGATTVRELGYKLGELYGERFRKEFFNPDETAMGDYIFVLVNGRRTEFLQGLDTPLKETDQVSLFPVVAGG